jgi:hypothetical protein
MAPRYLKIEEKEVEYSLKLSQAEKTYATGRKVNKLKPQQIFKGIVEKTINTDDIFISNHRNEWHILDIEINAFKHLPKYQKSREPLIHLFDQIFQKSSTFHLSTENIKAIHPILEVYEYRIRNIEDWSPKRISTHAQLKELIKFLFSKYDVPDFLLNGFKTNNLEAMLLFIHIGTGKSIRKFEFLPDILIGKKAFHHLHSTPDHSSFNEAFRRAQILDLGGDDRLFNILMDSKLHEATRIIKPSDEPFWISVIKFFIGLTMFDYNKIPEIIDYIYDQKFIPKPHPHPTLPGAIIRYPDHPNFTMNGRTPQSLLKQSDDWHFIQTLNNKRNRKGENISWMPMNINDYNSNKYNIIQLTSSKELITEGNKMKHCVGSYTHSCISGRTAIFSLRYTNQETGDHNVPKLTIEVNNGGSIIQVRAKYNDTPEKHHMDIVRDWANVANLKISKFIG